MYTWKEEVNILKPNAYDKVLQTMREMVHSSTFEKITVSEICLKADVSRNTFYKHFKDKNDVIEQIISNTISAPLSELRKLYTNHDLPPTFLLEWMYQQFYDDRLFYEQISSYTGQNSFESFIFQHTSQIIEEKLASHDLPELEKNYTVYFYAKSHTDLLIKWIRDGMIVEPKIIASYYAKWTLPLWQNLNAQKSDNL